MFDEVHRLFKHKSRPDVHGWSYVKMLPGSGMLTGYEAIIPGEKDEGMLVRFGRWPRGRAARDHTGFADFGRMSSTKKSPAIRRGM
jgi:hypothetical protein